jgi:hypothetical protein
MAKYELDEMRRHQEQAQTPGEHPQVKVKERCVAFVEAAAQERKDIGLDCGRRGNTESEAWHCEVAHEIREVARKLREAEGIPPVALGPAFEAERRAFWRDVYLGAMRVPPLIEVPPLAFASADTMRSMPIQTGRPEIKIPTPADIADAALAEFDKRFSK